jgi:hypothetical protein
MIMATIVFAVSAGVQLLAGLFVILLGVIVGGGIAAVVRRLTKP